MYKKRKKEIEESAGSSVEDMDCSETQAEEAPQTRKLSSLAYKLFSYINTNFISSH